MERELTIGGLTFIKENDGITIKVTDRLAGIGEGFGISVSNAIKSEKVPELVSFLTHK